MIRAFRFEDERYLYLLAVVPVLLILYFFVRRIGKRNLKRWGDMQMIRQLTPEASSFRPLLKYVLILLAFSAGVIALSRPQFGSKMTEVKRKGIEMIIAIDVSNSMMAEDIQPNRLENARLAIGRLIDRLENDKIGLVVFAGDAYVQLPITTDYGAAKLFLSTITTQIVPVQGTSVSSAIRLAMKSFSPESDKSRAIVIITDGENHEEGAIEAATEAADQGVVVHTIGMGSVQGSPIPVILPGGQRDFRTDHEGNLVITKLNEELLRQIAATSGGIYIRANSARTGLSEILSEVGKMEKQEISARVYSEYEEQFPYFAAVLLSLLFLEFFILRRKNRFISKWVPRDEGKEVIK